MRHRMLQSLVACAVALLLATLALFASAEALEPDAALAGEIASAAAPALDQEAVLGEWVEPEVTLAQDAGDTGLTIEYEDAPVEVPTGQALTDPDGVELTGLYSELADEVAAPDEGGLELMANPQANVGYAAIAPEAVVYADAELTLAVGTFPEGAPVYVEAVEREGALLRIRFDTEEARRLAQDVATGYVLTEEALCLDEADTAALAQTLATDTRTRYLEGVGIPCVAYETQSYAVMAGEQVVGLGVTPHSPLEIQAFVNALPSYRNQLNIYAVAAADAPYSIGVLSPVNHQSALNMINQVRYIAGLNADVGMLMEQEYAMAAASLVLRLNGGLSHFPARPAALADPAYDALYWTGYTGAGRANIAMGYTATGSILAYMADADDSNIADVGHRRWILNPSMARTVFGANGRFSAMYAYDLSGSGTQTKVAWPAQEMPLQYFSATDPWSVSFGRVLDASRVQVDLVRARDNRLWHFSQGQSDGFFNVENSGYGQPGCVIFRPNSLEGLMDGDVFYVNITDGARNEITNYTVHFFSLDLSAATPMDALSVMAVQTAGGNAISWNLVGNTTGYYVCRRTENTNYQIIADVYDSWYMDSNVSEGVDYYYQVYAHNASVTSRSAVSVQAKPVPPEMVALTASGTVTLAANATLQLGVGFEPSYASAALTWRSSKEKVAVVDANGLVRPIKKGSTIISVETDNGKSASVKVKVVAAPTPKHVILSAGGTVVMTVGETLQLASAVEPADAAQEVTWSTSKASVAQVGNGLVTALGEGKATITARAVNGKKAKLKVKVVDPYKPDGISLNYSGTVTLRVGQTLKLEAAIVPVTAQSALTWTSSKDRVAAVDANGNVTALSKGKATIKVLTYNGKKAKVKIKVVE